jgi:glucokinase-like ROK family protein
MPKRERFPTADQALVRRINLSLVLHLLRQRGPMARATLAQVSGLYKSTVSDLVAELLALQLVRELGASSSGTGRPSTLLMLNPQAGCIVSCEIGVDFIEILLTDFAPDTIRQIRERTSPDTDQTLLLRRVQTLLHEAVDTGSAAGYTLLGVAVGVPGIVERRSGTLVLAPNLGWRDVPLHTMLEQEGFQAPIFVDNEANMAALGEHYFGAAQSVDEVLYISVGAGLGGGIIRDGRLCRGVSGSAAEFGHMTMIPDGDRCNCGNHGCWETLVSQQALFRTIGQLCAQGRPSVLLDWTAGQLDQLTIGLVVQAAAAGDPVAREALGRIGHWLGIGIASLLNALNPALVVLGGALSEAAAFLLPVVHEEIQARALRWNRETVRVVPATHGSDACVRGGIATVYQHVLAQPNLLHRQNGGDERPENFALLVNG